MRMKKINKVFKSKQLSKITSIVLNHLQNEFEKWRTIRASVSGMGGVLAWVACQHEWRAYVGGMGSVLAWAVWVVCLHGYRASVGGVGDVLVWMASQHGQRRWHHPSMVAWVVCQHGQCGWCADMGGMLAQTPCQRR